MMDALGVFMAMGLAIFSIVFGVIHLVSDNPNILLRRIERLFGVLFFSLGILLLIPVVDFFTI